MIFTDLPPQYQERVVCSVAAAVKYDVPANIVLAVAELENGKPGQYSSNDNGSYDIGTMQFNTTNRLVKSPNWDIGLQKTGYISEAGRCLVMQTKIAGRKLIMVFLDSAGKLSRIADAERVKRWVESNHPMIAARNG